MLAAANNGKEQGESNINKKYEKNENVSENKSIYIGNNKLSNQFILLNKALSIFLLCFRSEFF